MGEWRYSATNSRPRRYTEVSVQLQTPTALRPKKESSLTNELEALKTGSISMTDIKYDGKKFGPRLSSATFFRTTLLVFVAVLTPRDSGREYQLTMTDGTSPTSEFIFQYNANSRQISCLRLGR